MKESLMLLMVGILSLFVGMEFVGVFMTPSPVGKKYYIRCANAGVTVLELYTKRKPLMYTNGVWVFEDDEGNKIETTSTCEIEMIDIWRGQ